MPRPTIHSEPSILFPNSAPSNIRHFRTGDGLYPTWMCTPALLERSPRESEGREDLPCWGVYSLRQGEFLVFRYVLLLGETETDWFCSIGRIVGSIWKSGGGVILHRRHRRSFVFVLIRLSKHINQRSYFDLDAKMEKDFFRRILLGLPILTALTQFQPTTFSLVFIPCHRSYYLDYLF